MVFACLIAAVANMVAKDNEFTVAKKRKKKQTDVTLIGRNLQTKDITKKNWKSTLENAYGRNRILKRYDTVFFYLTAKSVSA